jgi:glutathione S-transferase
MMDSESTARRTLQASAAALNKELAELRASQRNSARQAELQASLAELEASLASPWLNEDPTQAASAMSPYRVSCGVMGGLHRAVGTATVPSWLATTGDVV